MTAVLRAPHPSPGPGLSDGVHSQPPDPKIALSILSFQASHILREDTKGIIKIMLVQCRPIELSTVMEVFSGLDSPV